MPLPGASAAHMVPPAEGAAADEWSLGRHSLTSSPVPLRRKDGNLPVELTSFVGRRHELTEAKRLLSESHLVTFTGTGGVGKTRLALRVGADTRRSFSDGVWLVELGRIRDPLLVPETFVAVLGLRERSLRSPLTLLSEYLVERQLLIIVDNCEHLIAAVAELIEPLLHGCPDLRIIATSREPLRIGGEMVMRVPPLTVPDPGHPVHRGESSSDAVQLFVARARTALPEFALTEDNKATIGQICQQLDGLPLPIELAAVRLRAMSATQIRNRLADRYSLLTRGGNRGAPNRQQSLRLSVDWSYELCSSREQVLWAHLAIFTGGFDLDGAEGVADPGSDSGDILDLLESLVDKSILIREEFAGRVRFRMLEVLREYGRERLTERGEVAQLRLRHRDWCVQLVEGAEREWISPQQPEWIARLQREQANIRDALEYCVVVAGQARAGLRIAVALYPFWFTRGLFGEGRRWLDRLLVLDDDTPTPERVEALYIDGELAGLQGDLQAGWSLLARARELADRLGNADILSGVRYVEGNLAMYGGDPARALACFEKALDGLNTESTLVRRIETLVARGVAGWLLDDIPLSAASHDEVLRITESRGEAVYRAYSLWALGLVAWRQGHSDRAVGNLEKGVRLARRVDDPVSGALCLEALSWIAAEELHEEKSAVLMGAARALRKTVGSTSVHIPGVADFHERCEQRTRRALGDRAYTVAFERGKALTFAEAAAYALDENPAPSPRTADPVLTRRESQVAGLVADGLTNREIATNLVISPRTAQGHVEHILVKLGFTSRTQIAAWFAEQGTLS
ncbi:LuxR C-terminal-related transcriptional regulator [Rhodococcus jostii]